MSLPAAWALGLGVSLGATAAFAQDGLQPGGPVPSITVDAQASRDVAPDLAVVSIGVGTTRPSAQDAAQQSNRIAAAMIEAAHADGIAPNDIATTEASLAPVFDAPKDGSAPHIRGYQAVDRLAIKVHKLDLTATLVGHLLDQGANDLQGVDYMVADPEPLLDSVRTEAAERARHQAEVYAKAIGQRLGRVLTVRPESAPVVFARAMKVAAPAAAAPSAVTLASGTQKLEARVSVTWELQVAQP